MDILSPRPSPSFNKLELQQPGGALPPKQIQGTAEAAPIAVYAPIELVLGECERPCRVLG